MNIFLGIAAAFVTAALAGLGVGGGGLLIVYLTLAAGMEQYEAQGINLLFFIVSAAASLFVHKKHRKLNFSLILLLSVFGAAGAVAGSLITNIADPSLIRKIFGGMLTLSGAVSLVGTLIKKFRTGGGENDI